MQNIGIWDLEYYYTKKGFDADCMKISSFHKQRGDHVTLFENELDVKHPYDYIYIVRRLDDTQCPTRQILDQGNVRLIGNFKFFKTWIIPDYILGCRADYILYPNYCGAEIVQFCNHQGLPLGLTQDTLITKKNVMVLNVDDCLWKSPTSFIIEKLEAFGARKNVSFLYPISLKTILSNPTITEKFCNLKFHKSHQIKFINDLGDTYEDAIRIKDFILKCKVNKNPIYFEPFLVNRHNTNSEGEQDFERCLKILDLGKEFDVWFAIKKPNRLRSPYFLLFEVLHKWSSSKKYKGFSLLHYITLGSCLKYNCEIDTLLLKPEWWGDDSLYTFLITFKAHPEWFDKYCFRTTKDTFDNNTININLLVLNRSII